MSQNKLEYVHGEVKFQIVKPRCRDFQMLVTSRFINHYCKNIYEEITSTLLLANSKENMLFIDVGAHFGYYTLLVGTKYRNCKILAFEPNPESFEILKYNVKLNRLENVELFKIALSNTRGLRKFKVTKASDSCGFYDHPLSSTISEIMVQTLPLDDLLIDIPKYHSVIIKIDVEGHEAHVIRGMNRIFKTCNDLRLFIEFNPKCLKSAGFTPEDFLMELSKLGFELHVIDDYKKLVYKINEQDFNNWLNYLPNCDINSSINLSCIKKEKSLNICFFSHSSDYYGAERSLYEIANYLINKHGINCTVILPNDGILKEKLESIGAITYIVEYKWWCYSNKLTEEQIYELTCSSLFNTIRSINIISKINPDIIITNTITIPWGTMLSLILKIPHIWFIREFGKEDHGLNFFLPVNKILNFVDKTSHIIITNSNSLKNKLSCHLNSNKIVTIYPFITSKDDHDLNSPYDTSKTYFRIKGDSTKLLIMGSITHGKGQEDAILAVKELIHRGKRVELLILGHKHTEYAKYLNELCIRENLSDYVTFGGFVENPVKIINFADILLVCSRMEAFGRVIVEGMLQKKPVIATNNGGVVETITDGITGLLYEAGNYNQLADKIEYLINNPEKATELAENGYAYVNNKYQIDKLGHEFFKILENIKNNTYSKSARGIHIKSNAQDLLEFIINLSASNNQFVYEILYNLSNINSEAYKETQILKKELYILNNTFFMKLSKIINNIIETFLPNNTWRRHCFNHVLKIFNINTQ